MRYYGSQALGYSEKITNAKNAVDSTHSDYTYSISKNSISEFSVISQKSYDVANDAFNNIELAKSKLDDLLTQITSFYENVEDKGNELYTLADNIKEAISGVNTSITNMCMALNGSGKYSGVVISADMIHDACSPLEISKEKIIQMYEDEFLGPDGSLDPDAVSAYFDEVDKDLADGKEVNVFRTIAMSKAIDDYLKANDYSDEAYSYVVNLLMPAMTVQDHDAPLPDCAFGEDFYTVDPDSSISYMNFTFKDSSKYFLKFYSNALQGEYAKNGWDYTQTNECDKDFMGRTQFANIMSSITRNDHIALPYQIKNSDRLDNLVDEDSLDNPAKDTYVINVDYYPGFEIHTVDSDISDLTGSNNKPYSVCSITYTTETTEGTYSGFVTFDSTETYSVVQAINEHNIQETYVVTGDKNIGNVCDQFSTSFATTYLESTKTNADFGDYLPGMLGFAGDTAMSLLDEGAGSSCGLVLLPVAFLKEVSEMAADYAEAKATDNEIDNVVKTLDELTDKGNYYDNLACYGSYSIDNPKDNGGTMELNGTTYVNTQVAQLRLGFIASDLVSGEDKPTLLYDEKNEECIKTLNNSTNYNGYDNWLKGLKSYYSSLGYSKPFELLTNEECCKIIDAYNAQ